MWWQVILTLLLGYVLRRWYRRRQLISNVTKRHVFVTGCDTGFGNELARRLDTMGVTVFAGCLNDACAGADGLRKQASSRLYVVPLDVTRTESIQSALEFVTARLPSGHGKLRLIFCESLGKEKY
jgi:11-cis-retinol dehydrogenase